MSIALFRISSYWSNVLKQLSQYNSCCNTQLSLQYVLNIYQIKTVKHNKHKKWRLLRATEAHMVAVVHVSVTHNNSAPHLSAFRVLVIVHNMVIVVRVITEGWPDWVDLGSWFAYRDCLPDWNQLTHPSTNWPSFTATLLIETYTLPQCQPAAVWSHAGIKKRQ